MSHVSGSDGPNYQTNMTQVTPGVVWTDHANAIGSPDAVVATISLLAGETGRHLRGWPPGQGFAVPDGATITGIEITARCKAGTGA